MPEPLVYSSGSPQRSSYQPYPAPYRTKGPTAHPPAPALVRLPSDASTSSLPDPTAFPLSQEYRFDGGSQVGSSAASVSSGGGWRPPRSSARDSGASFGDYSAAGGPSERRSAYEERDLPEEESEEDAVEDMRSTRADSVGSASSSGSVHYNRYSAQPAWTTRPHRSQPSTSGLPGQSSPSAASSPGQPPPPLPVVGLGFSAPSPSSAQPSGRAGTGAYASRESSATSPSAGGSRWSQSFSHSAASSTCDHVVPYDSEDDKSDDGTSETSQYGWESSEQHRADMAEGAAVILVEDGRGKVVKGDAMDMTRSDRLKVELAGSTHLLLSSTPTPELVPAFLREVLPTLAGSVVVLDIAGCKLSTFPVEILLLSNLEELDVSRNPLRSLPAALGQLHSLRVLAANGIGSSSLPADLGQLPCLHTLSLRDNRFYSLPRWLCLLANLETLLVEGNPFQGFWADFIKWRILQWSPLVADTSPNESRDSFFSAASSHPYAQSPSPEVSRRPSSRASPVSLRRPDHQRSSSSASSFDQHGTLNANRYGQRPSLPSSFSSPWPNPSSSPKAVSPGRARANTTFQSDYAFPSPSPPVQSPPARASIAPTDGLSLPSTIGRAPIRRMKSAGALFQAAVDGFRPSAEPVPSLPGAGPADQPHRPGPTGRFVSLGKEKGRAASAGYRKASDGAVEVLQDESTDPSPPVSRRVSGEKDKGKFRTMFKKMSMGRMRSGSGTGSALRPPGPHHLHSAPSVPSLPLGSRPTSRRPSTSQGYSSSSQSNVDSDYTDSRGPSPSSFQLLSGSHVGPSPGMFEASRTAPKAKRRSYLNFDGATPSLNAISIPSTSPFMSNAFLSVDRAFFPTPSEIVEEDAHSILESYHAPSPAASPIMPQDPEPSTASAPPPDNDKELLRRRMYAEGLGQIMAYLQDLHDLSLTPVHPPVVTATDAASDRSPISPSRASSAEPTGPGALVSTPSTSTLASGASRTTPRLAPGSIPGGSDDADARVISMVDSDRSEGSGLRYKSDGRKRARVLMEIISTEETYVKGLRDLIHLYVRPSEAPVPGTRETVIPAAERKIVFNGLVGLLQFHQDSFLPSLRKAAQPVLDDWERAQVDDGLSLAAALQVADVFRCYNPFMRMYSTYINGFDNALLRLRSWTELATGTPRSGFTSPGASSPHVVTMGLSLGAMASPSPSDPSTGGASLSTAQRRRVKHFLRDAQAHSKHTQINLESYLLLPIQRIPRYKMLLEQLCQCTPPRAEDDNYILEDVALDIAALASSMNEEKRESESRQRLVQWQSRITGKFPSPLVQPHRKLLLDGTLVLQKFIKRVTHFVEVVEPAIDDGDNTIVPAKRSVVPVEVLESSDSGLQKVVVVLTSDLMILCQMGVGQDPEGPVDLYAVLRLQTKPQPASILPGTSRTIRVVDDKAILYLEAPNTSAALTWVKTLNEQFQQSR